MEIRYPFISSLQTFTIKILCNDLMIFVKVFTFPTSLINDDRQQREIPWSHDTCVLALIYIFSWGRDQPIMLSLISSRMTSYVPTNKSNSTQFLLWREGSTRSIFPKSRRGWLYKYRTGPQKQSHLRNSRIHIAYQHSNQQKDFQSHSIDPTFSGHHRACPLQFGHNMKGGDAPYNLKGISPFPFFPKIPSTYWLK